MIIKSFKFDRLFGGSLLAATVAGALVALTDTASAVTITYEQPNIFSANTAVVGNVAVNNFESLDAGNSFPGKQYSTSSFNFTDFYTHHDYTANYSNLLIANYGGNGLTGGSGYTGKFAANFVSNTPTTTLTFTDTNTSTEAGIKYFGLFFSSLDPGNQLTFYNGNNVISQVSINNFDTLVNGNGAAFVGGPWNQPGAFLNFYADLGELFTKIEFSEISGGGGFETDNHTFRIPDTLGISGAGVNLSGLHFIGNVNSTAVPEPFMFIGSIIGGTAALRMRKKLKTKQ